MIGRADHPEEATCCAYCDEPFDASAYGTSKTKDHIVPQSFAVKVPGLCSTFAGRGNLVAACGRCNGLKGKMLPEQIRVMANEHIRRATLLTQIADRAEAMITERRLLP